MNKPESLIDKIQRMSNQELYDVVIHNTWWNGWLWGCVIGAFVSAAIGIPITLLVSWLFP